VNAILILVAATGMGLAVASFLFSGLRGSSARERTAEASPVIGGSDSGLRLVLGRLTLVEGTSVLRGHLVANRAGGSFRYASGDKSETRNILFMDADSQSSRWLLPDDDHVIVHQEYVYRFADNPRSRQPVATLALVKPALGDPNLSEGRLLLLDPAGRNIRAVADGVRELHTAALNAKGDITILFERRQKFILSSADAATLEVKSERQVTVPRLQ